MSRVNVRSTIVGRVKAAAGTADVWKYYHPSGGRAVRVIASHHMPDVTSANNATNYTTHAVVNTTKSKTYHSTATSAADFTAGTVQTATLSGLTGADLIIAPGDVITFTKTEAASGVTSSAVFVLDVEEIAQ